MSNLNIFPLVKKFSAEDNQKIDLDKNPETEIQKIAFHYTEQLSYHFINRGFPDTGFFYKDMDFLNELLESILLRAAGKHHQMQDLIDEIMDNPLEEDEKGEEEKE
jgi:hypothetical protein